jgi:hypothetical protein
MNMIHRSEITKERWTDTSYLRNDGKEEFREKAKYGNRHAVFVKGALLGEIHYDKYNATDIPVGTINHASNYVEEKTSIPKGLVALGIVLGLGYIGYKTIKHFSKS